MCILSMYTIMTSITTPPDQAEIWSTVAWSWGCHVRIALCAGGASCWPEIPLFSHRGSSRTMKKFSCFSYSSSSTIRIFRVWLQAHTWESITHRHMEGKYRGQHYYITSAYMTDASMYWFKYRSRNIYIRRRTHFCQGYLMVLIRSPPTGSDIILTNSDEWTRETKCERNNYFLLQPLKY